MEEGNVLAEKKPGELPPPHKIPEPLARHLIVTMNQDPDWVWGLSSALRPWPEDKDRMDFRVFDGKKAASREIVVKDYDSLSEHRDMILFEGIFDKWTYEVSVVKGP